MGRGSHEKPPIVFLQTASSAQTSIRHSLISGYKVVMYIQPVMHEINTYSLLYNTDPVPREAFLSHSSCMLYSSMPVHLSPCLSIISMLNYTQLWMNVGLVKPTATRMPSAWTCQRAFCVYVHFLRNSWRLPSTVSVAVSCRAREVPPLIKNGEAMVTRHS